MGVVVGVAVGVMVAVDVRVEVGVTVGEPNTQLTLLPVSLHRRQVIWVTLYES